MHQLLWPCGYGARLVTGRSGFDPRPGQTKDSNMGILEAASLNASIMRLVPGLVGPVLVYCDWVGISELCYTRFPCVAARMQM